MCESWPYLEFVLLSALVLHNKYNWSNTRICDCEVPQKRIMWTHRKKYKCNKLWLSAKRLSACSSEHRMTHRGLKNPWNSVEGGGCSSVPQFEVYHHQSPLRSVAQFLPVGLTSNILHPPKVPSCVKCSPGNPNIPAFSCIFSIITKRKLLNLIWRLRRGFLW